MTITYKRIDLSGMEEVEVMNRGKLYDNECLLAIINGGLALYLSVKDSKLFINKFIRFFIKEKNILILKPDMAGIKSSINNKGTLRVGVKKILKRSNIDIKPGKYRTLQQDDLLIIFLQESKNDE